MFDDFEKFGDKTALYSSNFGTFSYNEILQYISRLKVIFETRSLVLIISTNSIFEILAYVSIISNNSVVMFLDKKTPASLIAKVIEKYTPDYLFSDQKIINSLNVQDYNKHLSLGNLYFFKKNFKTKSKIHPSLCVLLPTSGSMGSPKFVRLSKSNIVSNTKAIAQYLGLSSKEKAITNMPISYSYMFSIVNTHLFSGGSLLFTDRSILDKTFWQEAKAFEITSFSGVPFMYETLLRLGLKRFWFPTIKCFTQAGGRLDDTTLKSLTSFCKENKLKFFSMYGQTEASPRISYLDWESSPSKLGSIGKAIPDSRMWLEDENKVKIDKPYKIGHLVFEGENVFMGYAKNFMDLEKDDEIGSKLYTGDLAEFDEEGFFYLKGRIKRIAKIYGNRVNLDEIEERLSEQGYEVACIEKQDKIAIYFDIPLDVNNLELVVKNCTGLNKTTFKLFELPKIPRTTSQKIDYNKLKRI